MYTPPESNAYIFVLRPNGELRSYLTYDTIDRLYIDNRKIIDAKWQKQRNLKDMFYNLVRDISEGEQQIANRKHYYIAMDNSGNLISLPLMFTTFSIPSFRNKAMCQKAIKRTKRKFTPEELNIIFNDI